jgi:hypothetical protein
MPATNTKSPARVPRLHVPVGLIAPLGASVLTAVEAGCCAQAGSEAKANAKSEGKTINSGVLI